MKTEIGSERLNCQREWSTPEGAVLFYLSATTSDRKDAACQGVVFEQIDEGAMRDPAFRLSDEEARKLVTRLWDQGIRPNDYLSRITPELKAHIQDLRESQTLLHEVVRSLFHAAREGEPG